MLPLNTNAPARDTIKPEQISANSSHGSEQATGDDYQEVLSSLEQEHSTADNGQAHQSQPLSTEQERAGTQQEGVTADQTLLQQAAIPSSKVLPNESTVPAGATPQASSETGRQTNVPANTAGNEALITVAGQPSDSAETLEQRQGQLAAYRSGVNENPAVPVREANKIDTPAGQSGQLAKDFSLPATTNTADIAQPGPVDGAKQAEQASHASGQAVSLVYRQQDLYGSSRLFGEQVLAEQNTLPGTKPLVNAALAVNKTEGMATSMLNHQVLTDVRGITELPGAKTTAEVQAITSAQSQSQTLAMDTTLADRSQTAAGKYEWSMLKLDSQKQNWSRQLLNTLQDRIEMQANQQIKQAKIRLDPPELGRLELMVRIEGDRMSVNVQASNSAVRDALLETNERLRQELANQFGSSVDVNVGSDSSGEEFKNEEQLVAVSNVEATEKTQTSVPLTTGWLNALA